MFFRKFNAAQADFLLIYGPPLCGKGTLARSLASEAAAVFDAQDIRLSTEDFCSHSGEILLLNAHLLPDLPELAATLRARGLKRAIFTANTPLALPGFVPQRLDFLDYEEFYSGYKGANALGEFLLRGKSALGAASELAMQQALRARIGELGLKTLALAAAHSGKKVSVSQLFAARQFACGKNEFFAQMAALCELGLIFWLADGAKRRLFLADFGMRRALVRGRDFSANFANLLASEIIGLHEDLRCGGGLDFYSVRANLGFVCEAFCDEEFLQLRAKSLAKKAAALGINRVIVLSLSASARHKIGDFLLCALPLESFLLTKDEPL